MVELGFYLLPVVMIFSIIQLLKKSDDQKRVTRNYFIFIIGWVGYVFALSYSGVLESFSLPPRIPLLIVIPLIGLMIFFTSRPSFKLIIAKTSPAFLVYVQSFRILVELLIYGAFLEKIFPQAVTFEGTNFDILVGISAIPVGYLVHKNKLKRNGILAWNFISLSVLLLTVFSFISTYYFSDNLMGIDAFAFVSPPYLFLAALLLPFAVFFHILSIKQQLMKSTVTSKL